MAGPGIIIGRFERNGALICYRGNSIAVDLYDLMATYNISGVICCGATLHLHLTDTEFPMHYLFSPQALVCSSKIRNAISQHNKRRGRIQIRDWTIMCYLRRNPTDKLRPMSADGAMLLKHFLNTWRRRRILAMPHPKRFKS